MDLRDEKLNDINLWNGLEKCFERRKVQRVALMKPCLQ